GSSFSARCAHPGVGRVVHPPNGPPTRAPRIGAPLGAASRRGASLGAGRPPPPSPLFPRHVPRPGGDSPAATERTGFSPYLRPTPRIFLEDLLQYSQQIGRASC